MAPLFSSVGSESELYERYLCEMAHSLSDKICRSGDPRKPPNMLNHCKVKDGTDE